MCHAQWTFVCVCLFDLVDCLVSRFAIKCLVGNHFMFWWHVAVGGRKNGLGANEIFVDTERVSLSALEDEIGVGVVFYSANGAE